MASTNKTTNYQLSQFTGTDKPAWLGDYNQDMSKIDTGMKNNADDIAGCQGTLNTHQAAIDANTQAVETLQQESSTVDDRITALEDADTALDARITTAQNTANGAITRLDTVEQGQSDQGNRIISLEADNQTNTQAIEDNRSAIQSNETALNDFMKKFNLSDRTTLTSISGYSSVVESCAITLAQNEDGSIFKLYGTVTLRKSATTTFSYTQVPGLTGVYGLATNLKLKTAPSSAYYIYAAGFSQDFKAGEDIVRYVRDQGIAVDSNGYIYLNASSASNFTIQANKARVTYYTACLYFNTSFGDTPSEPDEA